MYSHPRWQLIPTYEVISIIDLAKLIKLLQEKLHQPSSIGNCNPLTNEHELDKILEKRTKSQSFTI